ncbi:MAG: pirin family protein [Bacteroidetes bacterium]|nr:pirin family protein [Bacteroidota bacterium]
MEKAIIHLSNLRGHLEGEWMRSIMTFNFGNYKAENREPFGSLQVFNEDTLAAGKSLAMLVEEDTEVLIIPLSGTIFFSDGRGNETYVSTGQVQLFSAPALSRYEVSNPFEEDILVSFLQIWLNKNEAPFIPKLKQAYFDLCKTNQLRTIIQPADLHQNSFINIGQFEGRKKGSYTIQGSNNGVYVFIINGAFEVQDRLLHAGDGLAMWNTGEIDFEALSNNAIVLLMELPVNEPDDSRASDGSKASDSLKPS